MKTFYNYGILGNSRMLATVDDKSQFIRIFWPHIDYPQHIERLLLGLYFPGISSTMHWINTHEWQHVQYYIEDTNILKTVISSNMYPVRVVLTDFATINEDILIRNVEIENTSDSVQSINLCMYCNGTSSIIDSRGSIFDFDSDSIIFYRHNNYMFITGEYECKQFQLTNSPFDACNRLFLYGVEDYSLQPEGSMIWEVGTLNPREVKSFNLFLGFSGTFNHAKECALKLKNTSYKELYDETKDYWYKYINSAKKINTNIFDIDSLYKRSLLVLKLMSDEVGGIIASPEIDEEYNKSGRYGYCWGRDASFITTAMDRVGLCDISKKFYEWACAAQDKNGSWHQRYYVDGNLAPGWGMQYDEIGSIIWGIWYHYKVTNDYNFLEEMWSSVYKGAEYLISIIDRNTGIPGLCFELWEMKYGQHAYTASAVYGGLIAASNIAAKLKKDKLIVDKWFIKAQNIKLSVERKFWSESDSRYLRSVNVKLNPWGSESGEIVNLVVNKKGYVRDFSLKDATIDSSLIGLSIPFNMFDCEDVKIKNTVRAIEDKLSCNYIGGILRFENDNYMGGNNPWIISTLWLALYYIQTKDFERAKSLIFWTANHKTKLWLLPEQVNGETGEPAWVIPLTWSHAMFIHVLLDLIDNNAI